MFRSIFASKRLKSVIFVVCKIGQSEFHFTKASLAPLLSSFSFLFRARATD